MFCRKCGKEIPDDSVFCPKCGTEVGKEISEKMNPSENKTESNRLEKKSVTDMPNKEPTLNAQDIVLLTKCSRCGAMCRPYPGQTTCQKCGALLECAKPNAASIGTRESQSSTSCTANAAANSLTQDNLATSKKGDGKKYCSICGTEVSCSEKRCPSCGVSNPYYNENTAEVKTVADNNTNAYDTTTTPLITTPSSNAFDNFVSKTAIAARVTIIASLIMYMILANGVLKKLEETSSLYGLVEAAIGLLGVCFLGAGACRIVCAFIKGAREEKDLGWMIFVTIILLIIAIIFGLIFKGFAEGVFLFVLMLFAYCERRLYES